MQDALKRLLESRLSAFYMEKVNETFRKLTSCVSPIFFLCKIDRYEDTRLGFTHIIFFWCCWRKLIFSFVFINFTHKTARDAQFLNFRYISYRFSIQKAPMPVKLRIFTNSITAQHSKSNIKLISILFHICSTLNGFRTTNQTIVWLEENSEILYRGKNYLPNNIKLSICAVLIIMFSPTITWGLIHA